MYSISLSYQWGVFQLTQVSMDKSVAGSRDAQLEDGAVSALHKLLFWRSINSDQHRHEGWEFYGGHFSSALDTKLTEKDSDVSWTLVHQQTRNIKAVWEWFHPSDLCPPDWVLTTWTCLFPSVWGSDRKLDTVSPVLLCMFTPPCDPSSFSYALCCCVMQGFDEAKVHVLSVSNQ